jgi:hypothetical protein
VAWQPLSVRLGVEERPYEGVPEHLQGPLWDWVEDAISRLAYISGQPAKAVMLYIGAMARLPLAPSEYEQVMHGQFQRCCLQSEVRFLSVIDALLGPLGLVEDDPMTTNLISQLDEYLLLGNSAWAVAPDRKSLTSRVDPTAAEAVAQAIAPHDAASDELAEAWRKAYGREPDPSDAWDHSIKAVEHILKPVVCPNNSKATLGNVLGDLRSQPQLWKLALPGTNGDFSADRLVAMLELIWPNPDRHGGGTATVVTIEQSHAVVHLAVTIVQWVRAGVLQRVP